MLTYIKKLSKSYKRFKKVYITVDIHGTIFKPTYSTNEKYIYYPFAKRTLQLLTNLEKYKLILWSSAYPQNIEKYNKQFKSDGIYFDYINENPECANNEYACFDYKFYNDLGLDDKFGFNPYIDWFFIYIYLLFLIKL